MDRVCPSIGGTLVLVYRHGEICMIWSKDGPCDGEREALAPTTSLGLGISPMMMYLVLAWQCQPTCDDDESAFETSTLESARLMLQLHVLNAKISTWSLCLCSPSFVEGLMSMVMMYTCTYY